MLDLFESSSRLDGGSSGLLALVDRGRRAGDKLAVDVLRGSAGKLNVVVGKLAELGVIKTKLLLLGSDTQAEARDEVHEEQDDAGHAERVGETGNTVGQLVAELDPVVVKPATGDLAEAIEVCNVVAIIVSRRL